MQPDEHARVLALMQNRPFGMAVRWTIRFTLDGAAWIPTPVRRLPLSLTALVARWYISRP